MPLCQRLAERGIDYRGLDGESAELLDELLGQLFSPDGLEEALDLQYESPDGVHYRTIKELISRLPAGQARQLPLLINGHRYGTTQHEGNYLILSPQEQQALLQEIEQAYDAASDWSDEEHRDITQDCLIDVLQTIIEQDRYCFARQG